MINHVESKVEDIDKWINYFKELIKIKWKS